MPHPTFHTSHTFKTSLGVKIYYQVGQSFKKDKYLVFLHGLGGDLTAWNKERSFFENLGYSSLAVDLTGHGLSEDPNNPEDLTIQNLTQDVAEVIKHERLENFVLIGHCLGGMITLDLIEEFSLNPKGLILVDTSFKPPIFSRFLTKSRFLFNFIKIISYIIPNFEIKKRVNHLKFVGTDDWDKDRLISDIMHTSLRSYFALCTNSLDFDAGSLVNKIKAKTLIIEGLDDAIYPIETAEDMHHKIKNSELNIIPNANHIIVLNNPLALEDAILKFLKKIKF